MPTYEYVALGPDGRKENGVVTADTARSARKELRFRNLTPMSLTEAVSDDTRVGKRRAPKLKASERILATRQLAIMIGSGMQVEQALAAISAQAEKPSTRRLYASLRDKVSEGYKFSEALADYQHSFSNLYIAANAAGEVSGTQATVLESLADHLEKSQKTKRKVQTALIYPMVLGVVALLVIGLLMVFVVPRVVEQFTSFEQQLPFLTRAVIWASNGLQTYGLILAGGLALMVLGLKRALQNVDLRRRCDKWILGLPLIGKLVRTVNSARFSRTFAMLVGSGTPVVESLVAARGALGNLVFIEAVDDAIVSVREGVTPSKALTAAGVFPPMLTSLIASGKGSDSLAGLIEKGADYLEDEFDNSSALILGLLEPLIIVILGTIVALIVLSIMLPIMQLNTLAFS
jgi:general secretion pathway protein F